MRNVFPILLAAAILIGCAGAGVHEPITPPPSVAKAVADAGNRCVWGLWDVRISADHQIVEVIPWRSADMHLNVVRLLEVTPCKTCLTIGNLHPSGPNELEADVTVTHPFPGLLKYTGFDVRGIFIAQTDFTFPVSGRKIAWGDEVPRMLNPDGYTPLFNPTEYPPTFPAALAYIPGKYATGGDLSATLNPFVAYRKDAPRRMFEAGGAETRTARIYAPPGPIHFGYAVDACWEPVENVIDPLTDFPPEANCLEAYRVSVDLPYNVNSSWMSQNPINVEVFDHQGIDTIKSVTAEAPELFSGKVTLAFSVQTGEESWLFNGMITNELEATAGTYPALVRVIDTNADQNLGVIDGFTVTPAEVKQGWARTWGGSFEREWGRGVAVDGSGNGYVTGVFKGTVDFDPGSGVDNHTSNGYIDVFLSKFDSSGAFKWARTWGGSYNDWGHGVACDGSGNVYVTCAFHGTVDFDPGSGVDNHTSNGEDDVFLSRFDSSGSFKWVRTWGGSDEYYRDEGYGVAVDGSGSVYVTGYFYGTVDFDPGSGVDNHASNGEYDVFLSKFDSSGAFNWARTWGGSEYDLGHGVAVDGSGNAYVTGEFFGSVDFDPGSGVDNHTSYGGRYVFLSKFDSSGTFIWARTWAGCDYVYTEWSLGVAVDGSGNAHVTGAFEGTVDFDPGSGVDYHTTNGHPDVFLSKFDSSGDFQWARTWGGSGIDNGRGVAVDGSGNVYVTGFFEGTVDFDPGSGVDNQTSNGFWDAFLSKFPPDGNW